MRTRIAFLLVVPVWIVLLLLAAMSGECGGGGSCVATARVHDIEYGMGLARGYAIEASDLTPYALATKRARTFDVVDEQTYALGTIDPTKVLVMKLAPDQFDDAGPVGEYLLLVSLQGSNAWDLPRAYLETREPETPSGSR